MLNVLQLCAGKGTRFKSMIDIPKPFIDVNGSPMFKSAIDSLGFKTARIHHLFQETHIKEYNPAQYVSEHHVIHTIDYYTDGAATSAASVVRDSEHRHEPWLIVDCDFMFNAPYNSEDFESMLNSSNESVSMVQYNPWDLACSYACIDGKKMLGVAEKQPISKYKNTGHYHWASGDMLIDAYDFYLKNNLVSKGEFYMAPLYNYLIQNDIPCSVYITEGFSPIGTPKDYQEYIQK